MLHTKLALGMLFTIITADSLYGFTHEQHELLLAQLQQEETEITDPATQEFLNKKITISYENQELVTIINALASLKGINVIFPAKDADKIKTRVTVSLNQQISLDQAWNFALSLLDINGYSVIQQGDWYEIVKNSKDIAREPLPLYIGVSPDLLPDSDARIRYIYYLSNLKIAQNANDPKNELFALLNTLLPVVKDSKPFFLDAKTNSIIVADKGNAVKAAMKVIDYLDRLQLQEKMEIVPLRFLSADDAARLFARIQEPLDKNRYRLDARAPEATYFAQGTKVMPYQRTNSIIILGKPQDIERVKGFVYKYLDVPLDQGESLLHVYQLQYLEAARFAKVLESIVKSQKSVTGQASGGAKPTTEAIDRYFDDVIIMADTPGEEEKSSAEAVKDKSDYRSNRNAPSTTGLGKYSGGNKLVIAARKDDWERIRQLIEELDTPQPQVVIEVLIAELTADQIRQIGSILRNPACFPLPSTMNAQSAQVSPIITSNSAGTASSTTVQPTPPATLQSDLLNIAVPIRASNGAITGYTTVANLAPPGSTVMSLNDKNGRTWSLLEVLDSVEARNIIANPHVIATNNKNTLISTLDERLLPDSAVNITNYAQIKRSWVKAPVTLNITPRISSANTVNLSIVVNIARFDSEFSSGGTNSRLTRDVVTNANVFSGDILTIGGLSRLDTLNTASKTPILGDLPIIGWLFKNRRKREQKTNLTIFVCPTIIQPRLRAGISSYTTDYINLTKKFSQEGFLFDSLRDPITRWFFKDQEDNPLQNIDDFASIDTSRSKEQYGPAEQTSDLQTLHPVRADTALQEIVKKHAAEDLADDDFINEPINTLQDALGRAPVSSPALSREFAQHVPDTQADSLDLLAARVKELYKDVPEITTRTTPNQALRA